MNATRQREPRIENRELLDIAHEAPCFLQLGYPGCGNDKSVPCHSDELSHGRGVGNKSHDCLAVPGCPVCHAHFTRAILGRDEYRRMWAIAHAKYSVWLWANDKIRVAA